MSHETTLSALLADHDTLNTINSKLLAGAALTKREFYVVSSIIGMVKTGDLVLKSRAVCEFNLYLSHHGLGEIPE